jgi:catechol 2,3-dioxygenase-like lactoylglutathione lyase family enzyme
LQNRYFDDIRSIESKETGMKRLHLHISVPEIEPAIGFYSTLFGAPPSVVKDDYAKWMLEDPRVNLAISSRARAPGVDHVGIQVDSPDELGELAARLKAAGEATFDQAATTCCYATSDKSWVTDTAGVRWESFFTHGAATSYGEDEILPAAATESASACCAPAPAAKACC